MKSGTLWRLLALLGTAAAVLSGQSTKLIDVSEPRPLWHALDDLQSVVGGIINYEDPPYANLLDCQDASTPQQRATQPPGWKLIVPRDGHLMATVPVPANGKAVESDALFDVNLLLTYYRLQKLPGDFKVEQANGALYVTPTKVLAADGVIRDLSSPLMVAITIRNAQRSLVDTTQAILDAVQRATGLRIVTGKFPYLPVQMVSFGASGEPARDALARLFAQSSAALQSYRLIFEPTPDLMRDTDYVLNVGPVANPRIGRIAGNKRLLADIAEQSERAAHLATLVDDVRKDAVN